MCMVLKMLILTFLTNYVLQTLLKTTKQKKILRKYLVHLFSNHIIAKTLKHYYKL